MMETKDFKTRFFEGKNGGFMNDFREKWSNMSDEEKLEFMDERMNFMKNGDFNRSHFFEEGYFSVEDMDKHCEAWMKKTPEEKETFIKNRNENLQNFFNHGRFFGRGRFFGWEGGDQHEKYINEIQNKWSKMTDEEKQAFIRKRENAIHNGKFDRDGFFGHRWRG